MKDQINAEENYKISSNNSGIFSIFHLVFGNLKKIASRAYAYTHTQIKEEIKAWYKQTKKTKYFAWYSQKNG